MVLWIALAIALVLAAGVVAWRLATGRDRGDFDELEDIPAAAEDAVDLRTVATLEPGPRVETEVEPGVEPDVEAPEVAVSPPRLRDRLAKTRSALGGVLRALRSGSSIDDATWEELEDALILADVGVDTTTALLDRVRERVRADQLTEPSAVVDLVEDEVVAMLDLGDRTLRVEPGARNVWLFVGVNGVGKTTSIGKLAMREVGEGRSVMLAAADTFRAAAAEQLSMWADRIGVEVVRGQDGADPGSVVFDAMAAAASREHDLLLVDTAGRLHTKSNLMEELAKLRRIVERTEGALKEVLLVVDASTGQNGLNQARQFAEAVDVTGIVLTKLDGTAKGGIVLAIQEQLGIPVKVVGVGEGPEDLVEFDPREFAAAIFEP